MRRSKKLKDIFREFNDRGTQWVLESPENLRGLMLVMAEDLAGRLDFDHAEQISTRFIPDNLRKQEADLLFKIPFRSEEGGEPGELFVYVMVEHQSETDDSMGFRLLFYMVHIWDRQRRKWLQDKVPVREWRFLPIIPIVFYTGESRWETPLSISVLMDIPKMLLRFVPGFDSLLLKLKEKPGEELTASGHPFGWLLRVLQKEHASEADLQTVLEEAVDRLSGLAEEDLPAWEKLVHYLYLLVHHRRGTREAERLSKRIEEKVGRRRRKAVQIMAQTSAEHLLEEGKKAGIDEGVKRGKIEGWQTILLAQLTEKFGAVPPEIEKRIRSLQDTETLERLLRQFAHAQSLEEMGL